MKIAETPYNVKVILNVGFQLFKTVLLAGFMAVNVLPHILKLPTAARFLQNNSTETLFGVTLLVIVSALTFGKRTNNFWWKYKNTYAITKHKFTLIDFFFSFGYFTLVIFIVRTSLANEYSVSDEVIHFLKVNSLLLIGFLLSTYYFPYKRSSSSLHTSLTETELVDAPIYSETQDLLNRGEFVKGLYNEIKSLRTQESFVFGLHGSWGEGKTSVINLLKEYLNSDPRFIVMNFEPWSFKDEEAILKAFFTTLEATLNKDYIFPNLRRTIYKYQKLISSGLAAAGIKISLEIEEETAEELKGVIEKYINDTERKLLIIIDEIDRLNTAEVETIFKLVRSTSRFKNTVFLLSLDDLKTMEKLQPNALGTLSKIIQKQITLPKIEKSSLEKLVLFSDHPIPEHRIDKLSSLKFGTLVSISSHLAAISDNTLELVSRENTQKIIVDLSANFNKKALNIGDFLYVKGVYSAEGISTNSPDSSISLFRLSQIDLLLERLLNEGKITNEQIKYFDKEFPYLYRSQISNLIQNFRDAKIFLNSLNTSLPPIASEVSPFDFICLELIKVFAKDIYNDIFNNWWNYVDERFEGDYHYNPFTFLTSSEKNKKRDSILQHSEEIFAKSYLNEPQKTAIKSILKQLFPVLDDYRRSQSNSRGDKRITSNAFSKYFTLKVPSTELSDTFIEQQLKEWSDKKTITVIEDSFNMLKAEGKLLEFLDKLRLVYLEDLGADVYPILLQAVSNKSHEFSNIELDLFKSEHDKALFLVLNILNSKIAESKIHEELQKIISTATSNLFAVDLLLTTKKERDGDFFAIHNNIDHTALREILSKRLYTHYIKNKINILNESPDKNTWLRILYQWSSNWSDPNSKNKKHVSNYMIKVFSEDPKRFVELLKSFNKGFSTDGWDMDYQLYSRVYNMNSLLSIAGKIANSSVLNPEEKEIVKKFQDRVKEDNKNLKTLEFQKPLS